MRRELSVPTEVLLRCIVYGQGGTGKTRFVGTFNDDPRTAPVLVLNAAGNPITILSNHPPPVVVTIERLADLDLAHSFLAAGQPAHHRLRELMELPPDLVFRSVAVDTLTEIQNLKNDAIAKAGSSILKPGGALQIQEWGESLRFMVHATRLFYALPLHVVLTCQERYEVKPQGGVKVRIFLQGQSGDIVPAYAELVGRMTRRTVKRTGKSAPEATGDPSEDEALMTVVFWESGGQYVVKNQVAPLTLGPYTVNPSVTEVLDAIERQIAANQSPPTGPD